MARIVFKDEALEDLEGMDGAVYDRFDKHFDKLSRMPPGRHLKHGLPYCVNEVGQGRIIYRVEEDTIYIIRCFTTHKEYEKWYKEWYPILSLQNLLAASMWMRACLFSMSLHLSVGPSMV